MTDRAKTIIEAWKTAIAAHDFGEDLELSPQRRYDVEDSLPDRTAHAVEILPRTETTERYTRESWLCRITTATVLRVRATSEADQDAAAALSESVADLAKLQRPLTLLDGFPVTLESIDRVLYLPAEMRAAGVYTSATNHTWRVEVEDPDPPEETETDPDEEPDEEPTPT